MGGQSGLGWVGVGAMEGNDNDIVNRGFSAAFFGGGKSLR